MHSRSLYAQGFRHWQSLAHPRITEVLASLPSAPGVFAVRSKQPVNRAKGRSDIVFIGVGASRRGLQLRVTQVFGPDPRRATNQRLADFITHHAGCQLAYVRCKTAEAAKALEKRLLKKYFRDHAELPPLRRCI